MSIASIPFIPGKTPQSQAPLARFIPQLPDGIVDDWLKQRDSRRQFGAGESGQWIIEPFGMNPKPAIEAARAGYRVIVAANNPINRFLLEMGACAARKDELRAALAELASTYKGSERLELHVRSLYTTHCIQCKESVEVEAFMWERQKSAPHAASYRCSHCKIAGDHPTTQEDVDKAAQFISGGLHRARALERVTPPNDPDRAYVEEALDVYLPRSIYILTTIINKLDGLHLSPMRRKLIQALLLTAFDFGNTLWSYPVIREHPRQLTTPPRFRENNIWLALERGIELWESAGDALPVTIWPETPPQSGGICLFEGKLRDLSSSIRASSSPINHISAVLASLPRPNQAFWTLSALWSGWLWEHEAIRPIKSMLRRHRYDWAWHTTALTAAFASLAAIIEPGVPLLGLTGEAEAGLLTAVLLAARKSGFDLNGIALRVETEQAQIHLTRSQPTPAQSRQVQPDLHLMAAKPVEEYLKLNGAPAGYLSIYTAALCGLVNSLPSDHTSPTLEEAESQTSEASPANLFVQTQAIIREVLIYRGGFLRYSTSDSPESGQWWLQESEDSESPRLDRLERSMVNYLVTQPQTTFSELETALCQAFPGLLTPEIEMIQICLDSYGFQQPEENSLWCLRPQDKPSIRYMELESVRDQLHTLGKKMGFYAEGQTPVVWFDDDKKPCYAFYPIASAIIADILLDKKVNNALLPCPSFIVLPGSRANLVAYKLKHDPRLKQLCRSAETSAELPDSTWWRFIKFRHLRWLVENEMLNSENFNELVNQDPLTYSTPQIRFL